MAAVFDLPPCLLPLLLFLLTVSETDQAQYLPSYKGDVNRTNVFWMVPSWGCKGSGSIEVEKYGIRQNEGQKFIGGTAFAIFYEHSFGKVPYFKDQNVSNPKNGGLPQMGDLEGHLVEAEKNIKDTILDENFNGIAVIDIEEFRPTWSLSWGKFEVYKQESIRLTRQQHPFWSAKMIEYQAEKDYEKASRKFFVETIRLGRRLRPKAKWGYYLFPKCNNDVGRRRDATCRTDFQKINDELSWLWDESTALFPSSYLYKEQRTTPDYNFAYSAALITETKRIKKNYCPHCEIHMFTKIEYDSYHFPEEFYSKQDLVNTLDLSIKTNLNGVVIWSTSQDMKNRCKLIQTYVTNTLGPFLQLTNRSLDKCRVDRCEGRGECFLPRPKRNPAPFNYMCRCERPFFGKSCEYRGRRLGVSLPRPSAIEDFFTRYNSANQFYARNGSMTS